MIKQEAPENKKPKEQLRAYSELAAQGHGLGPPGIAASTRTRQLLTFLKKNELRRCLPEGGSTLDSGELPCGRNNLHNCRSVLMRRPKGCSRLTTQSFCSPIFVSFSNWHGNKKKVSEKSSIVMPTSEKLPVLQVHFPESIAQLSSTNPLWSPHKLPCRDVHDDCACVQYELSKRELTKRKEPKNAYSILVIFTTHQ